MKSYPAYKESGVDLVGNIPSHWNAAPLKLVGSIVLGKMLTSQDKGGYFEKSYLRAKNIGWESVDADDIKSMWFSPYELEQYRLKRDDLLISEGGEVGRTAIWKDELEECYIQNSVHKVSINKNHHPRYHLYQSEFFGKIGYYDSIVNRVSIAHLTREKLKDVRFIAPPLPEQQAIADFLDRKTAQIDTLIEKKQRQIELLQEQRTALINQAVTKGLDPSVPMKDSGIEWLGEIPAHWQVKQLRRYDVLVQTGPFGSQLHAHEYVENGYPVVNPANMVNGKVVPDVNKHITEEKRKELSRHILEVGDIVFARRGELGRAVLITKIEAGWLCGTGSILIRFFESRLYSDYLSHYLRLPSLRDYFLSESVGSTMDNLNSQMLLAMPMIEPPREEQEKLASHIRSVLEKTNLLEEKVTKEIELLQEYRTALISAAVTGKIDVREESKMRKGFKGAVLIIGSLWWDNCDREKWREDQLDTEKVIPVFAPIRYGRLSKNGEKKGTYTMVISPTCYTQGMGTALLVPLQKQITTFEEIKIEAEKLWDAEGGLENRIAGTWGAIGLLRNDKGDLPEDFVTKWKLLYNRQVHKPCFDKIPDTPVLHEGILELHWVTSVTDDNPVDYDFFLATITVPQSKMGEYPTAREIAQACNENNYFEYFNKNQENGILTFQDEEIKKGLKNAK